MGDGDFPHRLPCLYILLSGKGGELLPGKVVWVRVTFLTDYLVCTFSSQVRVIRVCMRVTFLTDYLVCTFSSQVRVIRVWG